ncbi:endolytic transglycosylase MltG [Pelagibaculum spongiae]|uniref:Endolytic murein transglycosylase n=1 Tax=Pelagibaculum spongiae TaxID=2080658 RepID=A0A2V1H053_9GAMM|nr:endolytic transglycosylase MltG [Pelagibaculum spongiae]
MIVKIAAISLLFISLAFGWMWQEFNLFKNTPLNFPMRSVELTVSNGSNLSRVAQDLQQKGWIEKALYLKLLAKLQGNSHSIKAGSYLLPFGITPEQFLQKLVKGDVIQYPITLVEGWSFRQMLRAVQSHSRIKVTLKGLSNQQIMEKLGQGDRHPEGLFLPDTYLLSVGDSDLDILKRSYNAMQVYLDKVWPKRQEDLPIKTPYQALILASIVEKETGLASERPEIAGVFTRRMQKRMRLETDPTVIYGLGDTFDGNITRKHLRQRTDYNTYVIRGLPPTPIALPGREAIDAVLHPAEGKSLFFVATGNGGHKFSDNLKQHNRAVRKYQLKK